MNTQIETVTGRFFDVANPKVEDVSIHDIAWALSREPRFGSHSISEVPYTVGQHSICVMKLIESALNSNSSERQSAAKFFGKKGWEDCEAIEVLNGRLILDLEEGKETFQRSVLLVALLHDASEAYLRDLPSPVKHIPGLREAYKAAEAKVQNVILDAFGLSHWVECEPIQDVIHWADLYCRTIEAYHFMPSRGKGWVDSIPLSLVQLQDFEHPKKPLIVYDEFLSHFDRLTQGKFSID